MYLISVEEPNSALRHLRDIHEPIMVYGKVSFVQIGILLNAKDLVLARIIKENRSKLRKICVYAVRIRNHPLRR
jgi:hypothetical protein